MPQDLEAFNLSCLRRCIERNESITVSPASSGAILAARLAGSSEQGVCIRPEGPPLPVSVGESLAVSFKCDGRRMDFCSTVTAVESSLLRVNWPQRIVAEQRRNAFRVLVDDSDRIELRMWNIGDHDFLTDKPAPSQEYRARLRDLSTGGAAVLLLPWDRHANSIQPGQRVRVQISRGGDMALIDARARCERPVELTGPATVGLVFKRMDADIEGRKAFALLTRLVGELQAAAVRKARADAA